MKLLNPKNRRGTSVVEFAIVLPVFVLIFVLSVDVCNNIFLKQTLTTAAYEGVRTAIVPGANTYDIETKVREVAEMRNVSPVTTVIIPANFDQLPMGAFITVEVSTPRNTSAMISGLFSSNSTVVESVSMMKEY